MNIVAIFFAVVAVVVFCVTGFGYPTRRRDLLAIGLALLTLAWMSNELLQSLHRYGVH